MFQPKPADLVLPPTLTIDLTPLVIGSSATPNADSWPV